MLLDRTSSGVRVSGESVDVMLSPSLYTMKREALEIKFAHQAKKLAPSVLDDLLDNKEYHYSVFKDDQGWVFIAYDPQEISTIVADNGIEIEAIESIYFAQQSASMFSNPISLDANRALGLVDDIVTVMPKALYGERRFLSFDESFRPSAGGVSLGTRRGSSLGQKEAIILASIFALFGTLFLFEGIEYSSAMSKQMASLDTLLEDHPTLQSQYTRESIAAKYSKRDKIERKKREFLKEVSSVVRYGGEVQELHIDTKVMRAKLEVKSSSSYNAIDKSIKVKKINSNTIELEANV